MDTFSTFLWKYRLIVVSNQPGNAEHWLKFLFHDEVCEHHRVIILKRGSMFAFQWREYSPPLMLRPQTPPLDKIKIGYNAIPRGTQNTYFSLTLQLRPLVNKRTVSNDVTLWHCTFWSEKFASASSYSIVKPCMLSLVVLWLCGEDTGEREIAIVRREHGNWEAC